MQEFVAHICCLCFDILKNEPSELLELLFSKSAAFVSVAVKLLGQRCEPLSNLPLSVGQIAEMP